MPFFLNERGEFILTNTLILLHNDKVYPTLVDCLEYAFGHWRTTYISIDDLPRYQMTLSIIDRRVW